MSLPNLSAAGLTLVLGLAPLSPAPLRSSIPVLDNETHAGHALDATGDTRALNDLDSPQVGTLSDDPGQAPTEPGSAATDVPVDSADVAAPPVAVSVDFGLHSSGVMAREQAPTLSEPKLFHLITLSTRSALLPCLLTFPWALTHLPPCRLTFPLSLAHLAVTR